LLKQVTRHGRVVWYVRRGKGPRIRIRGDYGSEEFNFEYRAALDGQPRPKKGEPEAATLAWLIARYREVDAWQRLSRATRRQRENIFRGVTETAGDERLVSLPILPVLQRTLDAGPCGDLAFIVGGRERPLTKESFGNLFRQASRAAGVNKSCHGLRKIAATRCAERGATLPQMNAIFGWTGSRMALKYIEAANRKRLAAEAIDKLNNERTSNPSPGGAVRVLEPKF
jgi:hypothetical protein